MSRMILAILLAFVVGCGSKPQPTEAAVVVTPGAKVELTPIVVKPTHEMDPAKQVIPNTPVAGKLGGVEVSSPEVRVEGPVLILQKPEAAPGDPWRVSVELPVEPGRDGSPSKLVLAPADVPMGPSSWVVFVVLPKPVLRPAWEFFSFQGGWQPHNAPFGWRGGCAITVEFGKRENGKLPGKIYLSLPEIPDAHPDTPKGNFLAGTFVAECARQPSDPPGPDDVPYVKGSVTVRGASPNAQLKVGYIGVLGADQFCLGATFADLDTKQFARSNYDKPHVSTLIAGEGKDVPSQYEHSKLTPGRYLVFAGIKDGPLAWKWVDVKAGATLTTDLTIDATQVGALEVTPPLEALGKIQLAPAEEAGQPVPNESLFMGRALQLGLEADIVNRKAKFTKLAPGRYEVRANKQSRTVEIVAGKTVELDFDKK